VKVCVVAILASIVLRIVLHASGYAVAAYSLLPARMDTLAVGALVAIFATTAMPRQMSTTGLTAACAGLSLLAITALIRRTTDPEDALIQTLGYSFIALAYGGIIAAIAGQPRGAVARCLERDWLAFFGRYSYGLYVIHLPVLFLLPIPTLAATLAGFGAPRPAAYALAIIAVFSLCVGLAFVSWHTLEKQALKHKDRFQPVHGVPSGSAAVERAG
jgi:peptidoglycan/LPS O-acetylase OafA/YrhL